MASTANGHSNGMYTYESFAGNKKKSDSHFLWWCAGAHQSLLKEFPTEHTKQAGLGVVILVTFVPPPYLPAGRSILYLMIGSGQCVCPDLGLIIFNFDRFLCQLCVNMEFREKAILTAFPRIVLALLIGITIARPLELKIFEKEIDVKVMENRHKRF
jgi:hypothetical protein